VTALDAPTERPLAAPKPATPPPLVDSHGRFALDRELAQGGMGRVYAGRDLRLGREVAIKVLLERNEALARRFEREALVAARLQHPGIVTVYDAGFWPTGEPFLVMKLVRGRTLDRVIGDADTLADRLALLPHLIATADALAYAHDQGVVHRDLKPSNVVVGAFGETVVVDWGLAKDLRNDDPETTSAAAPSPDPELTRHGAVLGTPAYMPPEQAAGERVDARADVYALGAMLYQTLSGTPPAAASDRDGQRTYHAPAPLATLEPATAPDLLAIVAKAMAMDPVDRYPSAYELAEDLKRFQTGQLVAARAYSALERARRRLGAHRTAAALAVAAGGVAWALAWLAAH
jgi:serine/threonine protein kinase